MVFAAQGLKPNPLVEDVRTFVLVGGGSEMRARTYPEMRPLPRASDAASSRPAAQVDILVISPGFLSQLIFGQLR